MKKSQRWKEGTPVRTALNRLASRRRRFNGAGKQLIEACAGSIFPADVYFMASCNRALQTFDAFQLTMKADFYSTSMILLRVQLDSVLRCFGLLQTSDPHEVASEVVKGTKLSKLKDKHGQQMKDGYLVDLFSANAPSNNIIKHVYTLTSGYVHFSDAAIHNLLRKTRPTASGQRGFYIGAAEPDISAADKLHLIQVFEKVTDVIFELGTHWPEVRGSFGKVEDLIAKYGPKL